MGQRLLRSAAGIVAVLVVLVVAAPVGGRSPDPFPLDAAATRWVDQASKKLTIHEKVGQLIVPSFDSTYDLPEQGAVRAIAGEAAIGGRLPISLSGLLAAGHGLDRPVKSTAP
jgi:hypothetical protein